MSLTAEKYTKLSNLALQQHNHFTAAWYAEKAKAQAAKRIATAIASERLPTMEEVAMLIRQWGTRR